MEFLKQSKNRLFYFMREKDDTAEIEIIDRLLKHFDKIGKNNMKTIELYIDIRKQKKSITSRKLKEIYDLLTENKAYSIVFQKEKQVFQKFPYEPNEAMVRLCWRFIERIVCKCTYFFMNKKNLQCINNSLLKLIALNKNLSKKIKSSASICLMTEIIGILATENQKLETQLFQLLVDRGYICSIDEFYSINGLKKIEEDLIFQRKNFEENIKTERRLSKQNNEDEENKKPLTRRQRKITILSKNRSYYQKQKVLYTTAPQSSFDPLHVLDGENTLKPTNYSNWRKKRVPETIQRLPIKKLTSNLNHSFQNMLNKVLINQTLNKQLQKDFSTKKNDKEEGNPFIDELSGKDNNDEKNKDEELQNIIQKIKKNQTYPGSKLSTRIVKIIETVTKNDKKICKVDKKNTFPNRFAVRPNKIHRLSINQLIGCSIFKKESCSNTIELKFDKNQKYQPGINTSNNQNKNGNLKKHALNRCFTQNDEVSEKKQMMHRNNTEHRTYESKMFKNQYIKEKYSSLQKINKLTQKLRRGKKEYSEKKTLFSQDSDNRKFTKIKKSIVQRMKTQPREQNYYEATFPEFCRYQFIGRDKIPIKQVPYNQAGYRYQVYDARRRKIII